MDKLDGERVDAKIVTAFITMYGWVKIHNGMKVKLHVMIFTGEDHTSGDFQVRLRSLRSFLKVITSQARSSIVQIYDMIPPEYWPAGEVGVTVEPIPTPPLPTREEWATAELPVPSIEIVPVNR